VHPSVDSTLKNSSINWTFPLGAGELPVLMDEQLFQFPTILIRAGVLGEEIEINPDDLFTLTHAQRCSILIAEPRQQS
jgi:prolyl-tRNA editing enzyme YbaK/EbsC (Cys-tRNA(Pro) deacylase)